MSIITSDKDYLLSSYDYELPEDRIAQFPPKERGTSRLMVLDRETGKNIDSVFSKLPEFLPKKALLVVNNSRVVPARLYGSRPTGGKAELLLLTPPPLLMSCANIFDEWYSAEAEALLKPGRNIHVHDKLTFDKELYAIVLEKKEFGMHLVQLYWKGNLVNILSRIGKMPLPPYIKREQQKEDLERYQTLYAKQDKSGSVAAPTAGLHFTEEMQEELRKKGFEWAELTLHVGYGTFSPVREENIREHPMHQEYVEISPEAAESVLRAKAEHRTVIAVGTTSCRTLEGCFKINKEIPKNGWNGWTDIFIYPGYQFHVVDQLITNFHLPQSSLIMLVAALCGRERILSAYSEAVNKEYRFFSYGDAMFVR